MNLNKNIWQNFATQYKLSSQQLQQFQNYYELLVAWNKKINLTAMTSEEDFIAYHVEDSLKITDFYDVAACKGVADIGTGAGLPGIPLKIKYPEISIVLVEVIQKKVTFLREVIKELGLKNIEVCDLDWRTFLRQTNYSVDLVCARASLRPDELVRMFQASTPYKNATLIYWASADYEIGEKERPFFTKSEHYSVGSKNRIYCFFTKK